MSGPGMCGCCGGIVRYWCDTCNLGKASPECACGCNNAPRLTTVREVAALVEQASRGAGLMPLRSWYVAERVAAERRAGIQGDACCYCGRKWRSAARLARCEQNCDAEANAASEAGLRAWKAEDNGNWDDLICWAKEDT